MARALTPNIAVVNNNAQPVVQKSFLILVANGIYMLWQKPLLIYNFLGLYVRTVGEWLGLQTLDPAKPVTIGMVLSTLSLNLRDWFQIPTNCAKIRQEGDSNIVVDFLCVVPNYMHNSVGYAFSFFPDDVKNGTYFFAEVMAHINLLRGCDISMTAFAAEACRSAGLAVPYKIHLITAAYAVTSALVTIGIESYNNNIVESFKREVIDCIEDECSLDELVSLYNKEHKDFYGAIMSTIPETLPRDLIDVVSDFFNRYDITTGTTNPLIMASFLAREAARLSIGLSKFAIYHKAASVELSRSDRVIVELKAVVLRLIIKKLDQLAIEDFNLQDHNGDNGLCADLSPVLYLDENWSGKCFTLADYLADPNLGLSGNSTIPILE